MMATNNRIMNIEPVSTSRVILATPKAIFRAHIDPEVLTKWRIAEGMDARLSEFRAERGGGYRVELRHPTDSACGRSTRHRAIVRVRFAELLPDDLIVETAAFETEDPAYAGMMTITTRLSPVADGTKVIVAAENIPPGIGEAELRKDMESSLKKLALLLE